MYNSQTTLSVNIAPFNKRKTEMKKLREVEQLAQSHTAYLQQRSDLDHIHLSQWLISFPLDDAVFHTGLRI